MIFIRTLLNSETASFIRSSTLTRVTVTVPIPNFLQSLVRTHRIDSFKTWSLLSARSGATSDSDSMADFKPFPHFSTEALHAGQEPEQWNSMAVVPPISMSTTFKQSGPGQHNVSRSIDISYHMIMMTYVICALWQRYID